MKYLRSLKEIGPVEGVLLALCIAGAIAALVRYDGYRRDVRSLEQEIAAKKAELGTLQSAVGIVGTSVTDNQSMIDYLADNIAAICKGQTAGAAKSADDLNRAELRAHAMAGYGGCVTTAPVVAFLAKYNAALTARLGGDFPAAAKLFGEALAAGEASPYVDAQWKARSLEGLAYAEMKRARYDAARTATQKSLKAFPGFVFAEITAIKLSCAQQAPAPAVRDVLAGLRQRLDAAVAQAQKTVPSGTALHYARLDRSYVEADGELFSMCAYSGISAQPSR